MESTGFPDCIQISQDTADLLISAGKMGWIKPRADMVNAKGKGLMQTYFLEMAKKSTQSSNGDDSIVDSTDFSDGMRELTETAGYSQDFGMPLTITSKNSRLVEWIAEVLMGLIKEIAVRRGSSKRSRPRASSDLILKSEDCHVINEVKEIISLPSHISNDNKIDTFNPIVDVDPEVGEQLRHYLARIAAMYPENPCTFRILLRTTCSLALSHFNPNFHRAFTFLQSITSSTLRMSPWYVLNFKSS
jgi:hypothetical protein